VEQKREVAEEAEQRRVAGERGPARDGDERDAGTADGRAEDRQHHPVHEPGHADHVAGVEEEADAEAEPVPLGRGDDAVEPAGGCVAGWEQ